MLLSTLTVRRSVLALAIAMAWQGQAAAQASEEPSPAAEPQSLDRVVIKARGRDETLQGVPISVKAFSAKAIDDAGIRRPADFFALTPNLTLVESESVGSSFITIRGLSQVRNGDAPVAVVVDGVPLNNPKQFNQELFDIQSIEVLRGPQGALYGRNASGGAILITTKAPTSELHGFGQLTLGNGQHRGLQASLSGPIVEDRLNFRLGVNVVDGKGMLDNQFLAQKADPYNSKTLRGDLSWDLSQAVKIDARLNAVRDKAGALGFVYQPTPVRADCSADTDVLFDETRMDPNRVVRRFCANNPGKSTREMDGLILKADVDLGFANLTGILSRDTLKEYFEGDEFPYTASRNIDFFGMPADGTQTQYLDVLNRSAELRLTSPTRPGLRWMAGAFALKSRRFISSGNGTDMGLGIVRLTRDPAFDSAINPTKSWLADDNRNTATALFGNIDYDLSRSVEASLALRYDRDHREQTVDYRQLSVGVPVGCAANKPAACVKEATYSATQPKLSLRYKQPDGSITYASWGRGFRSGLFNQSGVAALAAAAQPPVSGVRDAVPAEITDSFELGHKTQLMAGKLSLNAAIFDTTVRNAPYFVFIGAVGAQVMVGIDKVHLQGGELEAVATLAPGLETSAGLGYTKSRISAYEVDPAQVGHWAPYVPQLSANLGVQYRFALSPSMQLMLRSDVVFKGKQYWDPENSAARANLTLLNLRAALEDSKGRWALSAGVENATDKAYNSEWVSGGFAHPALPRKLRVDMRVNF